MKRTWLLEIRTAKGLTTAGLAQRCGISQPEYTRIENGARTPRPKVAKAIAAALGFEWTLFYPDEEAEAC